MKLAQSINFAYDPKSDRIQLYACFKDGDKVTRVELTRRFLSLFLPSISSRLSEQGVASLPAGKMATSVQLNRSAAAKDHKMAQQIPIGKKQVMQSQLDNEGFLTHFISLKANARGVRLTVSNEAQDRHIYLQMTELELHRFIDQLTVTAAKAEWDLADPWAAIKSASYQPQLSH